MKVATKLVFVAFGDSLTVGYHSPSGYDEWSQPTPYTKFLQKRITKLSDQMGTSGFKVEFHNRGVVGELTNDMVDRFDRDVVKALPEVVIILGGSNDLGWGVDPQSVAENLEEMANMALSHGIQPVICTVPSVFGFDEGIEPRLELNLLIKNYCKGRDVVCVDLFAATADSKNRLREKYSDDGLHLNPSGYEAMADSIFSGAVSGIITKRLHYGDDPS